MYLTNDMIMTIGRKYLGKKGKNGLGEMFYRILKKGRMIKELGMILVRE
jgi:hypothetical protein